MPNPSPQQMAFDHLQSTIISALNDANIAVDPVDEGTTDGVYGVVVDGVGFSLSLNVTP